MTRERQFRLTPAKRTARELDSPRALAAERARRNCANAEGGADARTPGQARSTRIMVPAKDTPPFEAKGTRGAIRA